MYVSYRRGREECRWFFLSFLFPGRSRGDGDGWMVNVMVEWMWCVVNVVDGKLANVNAATQTDQIEPFNNQPEAFGSKRWGPWKVFIIVIIIIWCILEEEKKGGKGRSRTQPAWKTNLIQQDHGPWLVCVVRPFERNMHHPQICIIVLYEFVCTCDFSFWLFSCH